MKFITLWYMTDIMTSQLKCPVRKEYVLCIIQVGNGFTLQDFKLNHRPLRDVAVFIEQ